jgi:threonine dehydratase
MDEAKEEARRYASDMGLPFFEDGAEPAQFAGYGDIAAELLDQLGEPPASVIVPVGNGALAIGIGHVLAERSPSTLRVGVVAAGAPVMAESWDAGETVEDDRVDTFADGLAVRVAIPLAVEELLAAAQRIVRVSERELAQAVGAFARHGIRVEGAAAAGLAGLPQLEPVAGPVVLVVTGRNIDDELWQRAVDESDSFPG